SWAPLTGNLPAFGSTRCLREDIENEDLLFCDTEFALFASINRGGSWAKINNNLPTVAIHEVAIHPTAGEIAVATHGRSLWIMDVTALRQMKKDVLAKPVHLFKPNTTIRWQTVVTTGGTNRKFVGTNPLPGAAIYYNLADDAKKVEVKIQDISGATLGTITAPAKKGLNLARWDTNAQGKAGKGIDDAPAKKGLGQIGGLEIDFNVLFDALAQGADAINIADAGMMRGQLEVYAQSIGNTSGKLSHAEFIKLGENMMANFDQGKGKDAAKVDQDQKKGMGAGGKGGGGGGGTPVPAGVYRVILIVDGKESQATTVRVENDPNVPAQRGGTVEEFVLDPRKIN
ncbi:MAG TPA: hypothetical protein VE988_00735, partial [Gemmataceae bacterium]|nr:hypothetical protein [Gemmataceae bacterium]